jgi:hypothetical protein
LPFFIGIAIKGGKMNKMQKIICFAFSIFLLIIGITFVVGHKSLSAVIAIASSGIGLYFFFASMGKIEIRNLGKKTLNIIGSIFLLLIIIIGIAGGIDNTIETIAKKNAKYAKIESWNIGKGLNRLRLSDNEYVLKGILKNDSARVIKKVYLSLSYYTPDNYLITRHTTRNVIGDTIITPGRTFAFESREYISSPSQAHIKKLGVYKVYFR